MPTSREATSRDRTGAAPARGSADKREEVELELLWIWGFF